MNTKLLLVITFALLFSACAAPITTQAAETVSPSEPTLLLNENPLTIATYTDDLAGFSLDYPAGWYLETSVLVHAAEVSNYSISISSWDMNNPPPVGTNGLPGDGTKFDVTVIKNATTLDVAVDEVSRTGTPVLAQQNVTLANGVPAVVLDYESFAGPGKMLISILNGNVIYVTGYGDLEYFEAIALSLRAK